MEIAGAKKMYSHYFATKSVKYIIISEGPRPVGKRINVIGKAEARKVSKAEKAEPYNF